MEVQNEEINETETPDVASEFELDFKYYLTELMKEAGYTGSECAKNGPNYLQFKQMAVLCSFKKIHYHKIVASLDLSEDEQKYYLSWKELDHSINKDPKLEVALQSHENGLKEYIESLMWDAGYPRRQIEQNNTLFIPILSEIMIIEAEKIIYEATDVVVSNKKRRIDAFPESSSISPINEATLSFSSTLLVKTTKKHNIYKVSTPIGIKVLKTSLTDNPTADVAQNLENELKIGRQITSHILMKSHVRTAYQNKAFLLEWVDGDPLSQCKKLSVPDFYDIGRKVVSCVLEMHNSKICHLNLSCDHFILSSDLNDIKMIGFGSASSFDSKQRHNPNLLDRNLRYISPK